MVLASWTTWSHGKDPQQQQWQKRDGAMAVNGKEVCCCVGACVLTTHACWQWWWGSFRAFSCSLDTGGSSCFAESKHARVSNLNVQKAQNVPHKFETMLSFLCTHASLSTLAKRIGHVEKGLFAPKQPQSSHQPFIAFVAPCHPSLRRRRKATRITRGRTLDLLPKCRERSFSPWKAENLKRTAIQGKSC